MKTASSILFEYGIDIMKMDDDFNSQLLFAMERYAEQFKPIPSSTVSIDVSVINEHLTPENCPYSHDPKINTGTLCSCGFDMSQLSHQPSSTVDLEREAEELYPFTDPLSEYRIIDARQAYIKGRQTSQKGLEELIEWMERQMASAQNKYSKGALRISIRKATELLTKK